MNKSELTASIAESADISKAAAGKAIDAMTAAISETLKNGDSVTLIGFGTFSVKDRPERQGKNPQTGEPMTIKARKAPHFKAGTQLKASCNP